jgi:hypothetical protein
MRHYREWLVGAALAALTTLALAQPVSQNNVSGNECWNAGQGPGGPSSFLCINLVRNGTAMNLFSGSGAVATTATQANSTMMWTGAAPTTWTITLPNPAFDGEIIQVSTDTTLTTMVTVQSSTTPQNQVVLAPTFSAQTVTANTSVEWQFNFATLRWIKIR